MSSFQFHVVVLGMAVGMCVEHARKTLRAADAVCFDVDSTVICKEGIDELAAFLGVGQQVARHSRTVLIHLTPLTCTLAHSLIHSLSPTHALHSFHSLFSTSTSASRLPP